MSQARRDAEHQRRPLLLKAVSPPRKDIPGPIPGPANRIDRHVSMAADAECRAWTGSLPKDRRRALRTLLVPELEGSSAWAAEFHASQDARINFQALFLI